MNLSKRDILRVKFIVLICMIIGLAFTAGGMISRYGLLLGLGIIVAVLGFGFGVMLVIIYLVCEDKPALSVMKCKACGKEYPPYKFCPHCGYVPDEKHATEG